LFLASHSNHIVYYFLYYMPSPAPSDTGINNSTNSYLDT